eukprot:355629-Pleurochrysis_carterae.AAC.2
MPRWRSTAPPHARSSPRLRFSACWSRACSRAPASCSWRRAAPRGGPATARATAAASSGSEVSATAKSSTRCLREHIALLTRTAAQMSSAFGYGLPFITVGCITILRAIMSCRRHGTRSTTR